MKSSEPDLQLKSPIQKNYNRAVFYTYMGVIVLALLTAWVFFLSARRPNRWSSEKNRSIAM